MTTSATHLGEVTVLKGVEMRLLDADGAPNAGRLSKGLLCLSTSSRSGVLVLLHAPGLCPPESLQSQRRPTSGSKIAAKSTVTLLYFGMTGSSALLKMNGADLEKRQAAAGVVGSLEDS